MKNVRKSKGITLVALVITIIILLILAGITINSLTGSGLFKKAQESKEKHENAEIRENEILSDYENKIDKYVNGTREENSSSKIQKTVLFNEVANLTNVEYELNDSIKNYSFLIIYASCNHLNSETSTLVIDTDDLDYDTNKSAKQRYMVGVYLGPDGFYGIRFGFISDKKFIIDNINISSAWNHCKYGIYKIIGIK